MTDNTRDIDPKKSMYAGLTLLGKSGVEAQKKLETFDAPDGVVRVTLTVEEFTSVCPVTGQPDFGKIEISYVPDGKCVESKSLKLYCQTFREEGIFWEQLAATIMNDLRAVLDPYEIEVTTVQAARGGISLVSTAMWHGGGQK